jgi:DNA-binding IscR family transcriptional regulator
MIVARTTPSLDSKSIAAHVVVMLAHAQELGRAVRLDELASEIGVRKSDVRDVVTRLHAEGHVDALRLRLTMTGLALATSLADCKLREPRRHEERLVRVA